MNIPTPVSPLYSLTPTRSLLCIIFPLLFPFPLALALPLPLPFPPPLTLPLPLTSPLCWCSWRKAWRAWSPARCTILRMCPSLITVKTETREHRGGGRKVWTGEEGLIHNPHVNDGLYVQRPGASMPRSNCLFIRDYAVSLCCDAH